MKIIVTGPQKTELIKEIKKNYPGFKIVKQNPEVVICYGGDGTLLRAERIYPGIPKVVIKNSKICKNCINLPKKKILKLLSQKKYKIKTFNKVEARVGQKKIISLNDIVVMHKNYNKAIRFKVYIDNKLYEQEILGDGIIVATPFGSTAYYQSVTRSNFSDGLGLAFNNAISLIQHLVLKEDAKIKVELTRGPAVLVDDNNQKFIELKTGQNIYINKSKEPARLCLF